MLAEHIFYSGAIAILVGMLFYRFAGRDHSWIIIVCAWAPDIDLISNTILKRFGFTLLYEGQPISHGVFHNLVIMIIFSVLVAFLLHPLGIKFFDSLFFSVIGFSAHLVEDALVFKAASCTSGRFHPKNWGGVSCRIWHLRMSISVISLALPMQKFCLLACCSYLQQ